MRDTAKLALSGVPWLAFDPSQPTQGEARLTPDAIAVILLQADPQAGRRKSWLPVSSWGRLVTSQGRTIPIPMLEAKAFQEGLAKMASAATTTTQLELQVSFEL